jgi:hypothetical protein
MFLIKERAVFPELFENSIMNDADLPPGIVLANPAEATKANQDHKRRRLVDELLHDAHEIMSAPEPTMSISTQTEPRTKPIYFDSLVSGLEARLSQISSPSLSSRTLCRL